MRAVVLAGLWWVLTEGAVDSWLVGVPAVIDALSPVLCFPRRRPFQGRQRRARTRFADLSHAVETVLRRGVVFGVVLLVLIGLLIGLFAFPGNT